MTRPPSSFALFTLDLLLIPLTAYFLFLLFVYRRKVRYTLSLMGIWFGVFNMSPSLKTMTILLLVSPTEVVAWAGFGPRLQLQSLPLMQQSAPSSRSRSGISTSQLAAATGGGGFGSNSSAGKEIKLKPKQQWDRYTALKKESAFKVGVRIVDDSSVVNDWLDVGSIKASADIVDNGTEIAVARQRALIAEVCSKERIFKHRTDTDHEAILNRRARLRDPLYQSEWILTTFFTLYLFCVDSMPNDCTLYRFRQKPKSNGVISVLMERVVALPPMRTPNGSG